MSSTTLPPCADQTTEDNALKVRLQSSLEAFTSGPDDVWVSAGFCFDAIAESLDYAIRHYPLERSELETIVHCMVAEMGDFERPNDFASDISAMLYFFVELAANDLALQPRHRFRETLYYATIRVFDRDIDLLPFQMWKLIHPLSISSRRGLAAKATEDLAAIRSFLLGPRPAGEDPRYQHEPDQYFLNTSDDEVDETALMGLGEVGYVDDPTLSLNYVLRSTEHARARLARMVDREQTLLRQTSPDDQSATLLADRIRSTQSFIAWVGDINDGIRKQRARRLL